MDWPTASVAAIVGGGVVAVIREVFTKKSQNNQDKSMEGVLLQSLQQDSHERRELLGKLVQAQSDTAFSLREMTMMNKHQDARIEEFHRQTNARLQEVTDNQKEIKTVIESGVEKIIQKIAA